MQFKRKETNIVGTQIGVFKVWRECNFKSKDKHRMFHVKCVNCGWETDMQMHQIGYVKQCNHLNVAGQYIKKYAWKNKRLQRIYKGIITRCYNEKDGAYKWYGAKGIKICAEWLSDPLKFEKWAFENGYEDNLTIDRINENSDYSPENCRWITLNNNAKYKSTTKLIEVNNIIHTGREWTIYLNIGTNTINTMLRKYSEEQVREFIKLRLQDPTKVRHSNQTWMSVYGLD